MEAPIDRPLGIRLATQRGRGAATVNDRPVLTVGPEPTLQNHLTNLLQGLGYAPVTACSVEEALAAVATSRFDFSLVAMDLAGADGLDFLRRLKLQGGEPGPIIMLFEHASA
ncbi:MAG: hypothetical protein DME06_14530, partial [Candidatus Rokuibacteriota bacterium]